MKAMEEAAAVTDLRSRTQQHALDEQEKELYEARVRNEALEERVRRGGAHPPRDDTSFFGDHDRQPRHQRPNVRVKAEAQWPTYDGTDVYYDIEDFFRDFKRIGMLACGGQRMPPHEQLEMLRSSLQGVPRTDLRNQVDDDVEKTRILESGSYEERQTLLEEVEQYLLKSHHRPMLERQRRARAEYDACSMRLNPPHGLRHLPDGVPAVPEQPEARKASEERRRHARGLP